MSLPLKLNFSDYDNFLTEPNYTTSAEAQDYFRNMDMLVEALIDVGLWQPETNYPNGHVVFSPNMPNGTEAVCVATNGGKSSNTEPSWGEVGGDNVSDGTCFWKLRWKHWSKSVEEIADLTTGATNRLSNKAYTVGNVVYTDTNLSVALKCTTTGTTSNAELDISGVSVGESVADGGVVWEVVKRDLSEEVKANADNFANYLALDGSKTMNSPISTNAIIGMRKQTNVESLEFDGGKNYAQGAYLVLYGSEYPDNTIQGSFNIASAKNGKYHRLRGYPDGRLTWDGNSVITTNEVQQGRGLEYLISPRQIRRINITYPKPLKSVVYPKCWMAGNTEYHYDPVVIRTANVTTTGFTIVISNGLSEASYYVDFYWEVIGEVAV